MIVFDVKNRKLDVKLSESVIQERLSQITPLKPQYTSGVFAKYIALVSSAREGAITEPGR